MMKLALTLEADSVNVQALNMGRIVVDIDGVTTLSRPEVVSGHTDVIYSTSVCHILAVRKSTLLPIDTIIRHQVSDIS
ncbi:hypothetical protein M1K99_003047 [Escherichia coli]|nr:hypothetical protein [Escherichia coli]EEW5437400.1 hypothetical protein [Escherichia coli]EFA1466767.1 hypothetical protein [Escherichia coli]EFJ5600767.1 hypothetical protein [Escherichia coli]EFM1891783.1 hypothetical protein [Escherichia coli]